jgi:chromosome segregation ATPase
METMRKTHEKEMRIMRNSMANEIETMTGNFSNASRDLISMTHRYEELDKKFKMYYLKSDKYIKEREAKLEELQAECDHLAEEYGRFDNLFNEERKANNILRDQLQKITDEFDACQQLSHKRYLEIIDYEQRYRGIDITKLHEQIEYLKCKIYET